MIRFVFLTSLLLLFSALVSAESNDPQGADLDLAVREALFSAVQKDWLETIVRLDKELQLRGESVRGKSAKKRRPFSLAENTLVDSELSYRMYQRDGQLTLDMLEKNSDDTPRNTHLYRLAQLYLQKGQVENASLALGRVRGEVAPEISADLTFFRAQLLMIDGKYQEAAGVLDDLKKSQSLLAFVEKNKKIQKLLGMGMYNLGVAHLSNGNEVEGLFQLDVAGQLSSSDETSLSIRDKANLVHGERLIDNGSYGQAGDILDRVRLTGPFSSLALLSAGWVATLQEQYEQALVPWTLLSERDITINAVQEAKLAVPYCYSKLGVYKKAALLYGQAAEAFEAEGETLANSISAIQNGQFLKTALREESKHDPTWVVKLRNFPDMPETHYLIDLMTTHEFQESLQNYLDLGYFHKALSLWQKGLSAYEELITKRRAFYEPLLPDIDRKFRKLDRRVVRALKKRDEVGNELKLLQEKSQPDLLASAREKRHLRDIDRIDKLLKPHHVVKTKARIERLRGLVRWDIYANYDQRLEKLNTKFRNLDGVVNALEQQRDSFILIRQAATDSYSGYGDLIDTLRSQIKDVQASTATAMRQQGTLLEEMLIAELSQKLEKIKEMQVKAQFAMAENYDRAVMKRGGGGGAR